MHLFKGLIPNINISVSLNNLTTYQDMFIKKKMQVYQITNAFYIIKTIT
jgi:hypothetical protein